MLLSSFWCQDLPFSFFAVIGTIINILFWSYSEITLVTYLNQCCYIISSQGIVLANIATGPLSELSQIQLETNLAGKWYVNAKISSMKIQNKGVSSNLHVLMQKVKRLHYQKKTATKYSSERPTKMHLRSKIGFNTSKT